MKRRWFVPAVAGVLYFSEGLPFGIVKEFVPMYLRFRHVDLTNIGLLNIVGFAWTLKFLWSPLVDTFGAYRRWISAALIGIAIALFGMASTLPGPLFYSCVALLALASATQDIAVDAFTIRATPHDLLGPVNSIRVTAYRIALTSPGILAAVAQRSGWGTAYSTAAVVALVILLLSFGLPDDRGGMSGERPDFVAAFKHWLTRPSAGLLLAIAFTYRLGEFAVVSMIKPYWVDRGYSPAEIGTITSIIGVIVSIAGAIAGGAIVARIGIWRSLLWLGFMQCLSNLGYALVATFHAGRWSIYAAAITENIGYGLGTAAFLAFLMSICDRERAATEYALLSAAYGFTGTIIASASGYIAKHAGYPAYFWLTVLLGIPALLLLPTIRGYETQNLRA
ncbi:MAG TPA: MFS transporter [Thermoanaerobaculia bacterium]|nr:MFS transporter [Thermoanaerobaculia bacterium]